MKRALFNTLAAIDAAALPPVVVRTCRNLSLAAAAALGLAACAADTAETADSTVNDPLEPFNRYMLSINEGIDTVVLRPVAVAYRDLIPYPVQDAVHNFLTNLTEPVTLVNQLLQGQVNEAGHTFGRFMANSMLGLGGTIVIVDIDDVPGEREDFGQTLASWGVDEGIYLVLPVIGPTNTRDTAGRIVDFFTDPFNMWAIATGNGEAQLVRAGLTVVDTRVRTIDAIDALQEDSLDFYARLRSAYQQRRNAEIENRASSDNPFGAAPFDEEDMPADEAPAGDAPVDDSAVDDSAVDDSATDGADAS